MAGNNDKPLLPNPWSIILLALLAGGVLVSEGPLRTARPPEPEQADFAAVAEQDVGARLWQDPMFAVESYREQRLGAPDAAKEAQADADRQHDPANLKIAVDATRPTTILAVSVFGGAYAEAAETRRRSRYAVIAALGAEGYLPRQPDALGFIHLPPPDEQKASSRTNEAQQSAEEAIQQLKKKKLLVPYEWFREAEPAGGDQKKSVLVMWLNEDRLSAAPDFILSHLFETVAPDPSVGRDAKFLIGPLRSSVLSKLVGERNTCPASQNFAFKVISPGATTAAKDLFEPAGSSCATEGCADELKQRAVVRATGTDDELARLLIKELSLRGVNRPPRWWFWDMLGYHGSDHPETVPESKRDYIVLIREWDTYSKNLTDYLKNALGCPDACVREYAYLRGIDGIVPSSTENSANKNANGSSKNGETQAYKIYDAPVEHAEGRSQYDYIMRVAAEIGDFDRGTASSVKAIGIIGNDVYDKLLVLQALQPHLRNKVYFTTDLDARFLHADQKAWTRNLVVASNFGLFLPDKWQGNTPPFRDSYQTATYYATRMALGGQDLPAVQPALFEIGHTAAVALKTSRLAEEDKVPAAAGRGPEDVQKHFAAHASSPDVDASWFLQAWLYTLLLLAVLATLVRLCCNLSEVIRLPVLAAVLLAASFLIAGLAWIMASSDEPVAVIEGVSAWPGLVLRVVGLLAALAFSWYCIRNKARKAVKISERLGLPSPSEPRKLRRSFWHALAIGPHLDLSAYDGDGKPCSKETPADVRILWQTYLRVTGWRSMLPWLLLYVPLTFFIGMALMSHFGPPYFPGRGAAVRAFHYLTLFPAVITLWAIVYWVGYETWACSSFIKIASDDHKATLKNIRNSKEADKYCVPWAYREPYLTYRLVALATRRIQVLIYAPFILILFMVFARATVFDATDFPLPLVLLVSLASLYQPVDEVGVF